MVMSGGSQIKLISESFIKPKHEQQIAEPELEPEPEPEPYYLGPIDYAMLSLEPMQKGLLYKSKPQLLSSFFDNLKLSLSFSLLHFHPLAGRLATQKFPEEHASLIYVDCSKGPGARILHASVDLTVSDILSSTDLHPIVRSLFDLGEKSVNHDGHTWPLLSVQVTELLDGMFIGFTMNHAVADGTTLWNFITTLSEVFLQLEGGKNETSIIVTKKPVFGSCVPDGYGPILKLPFLESEEFVSRFDPGPLRERIFNFSPSAMAKLKAKARTEAQNASSFQALCAFLWRCVTKARNLNPNEETSCSIIVNTRRRLDPPYNEAQFGNFLTGAQITCEVGELIGQKMGWAAGLLSESIVAQDDEKIREFLNMIVKAPIVTQTGSEAAFYKANSMLIAGSSRFDMYGPEFGLGKGVAVLAGYANKDDGKVTANPGRDGDGSVDLEVCLKPHVMDALELDHEFMSYVSSI